jgi:hypothetical protein
MKGIHSKLSTLPNLWNTFVTTQGTLRRASSQLLNKFKEGLKGSGVESGNSLLQFCTYYTHAWIWGFEVFLFFLECPHVAKTSLEWLSGMDYRWMYA